MSQRPQYTGNRAPQPPTGRAGALRPEKYEQQAKRIIDDGDAQTLVEFAEQIGSSGKATRTSVRRLYGEARRIDFLLDQDEATALRRARLLEPRLIYQANRHEQLTELASALLALLRRASTPSDPQGPAKYRRFAEFFEAVVAYMPEK